MTPFRDRIARELERARAQHAPIANAMEGWAVIQEEIEGFWAEVRLRDPFVGHKCRELARVAAMAMRLAEDVALAALYSGSDADFPQGIGVAVETFRGLGVRIRSAHELYARLTTVSDELLGQCTYDAFVDIANSCGIMAALCEMGAEDLELTRSGALAG